jgi:ADP-heptose:LPS heptosyltransferase
MPKRFFLSLVLLILALSALAIGVNAALDHLSKSSAQNSVVIYDDHGTALYAYTGNLAKCTVTLRPNTAPTGRISSIAPERG